MPIQTKLGVGHSNDAFEREADRLAAQVLSRAEPASRAQRESGLQQSRQAPTAGSLIGQIGAGRPLPERTRTFFESRFGHDFGGVRVHADQRAASAAQSANARAFTMGQTVVFDRGQYAPETSSGRRLLAHELTHVVQQRQGGGRPRLMRTQYHGCDQATTGVANPTDMIDRAIRDAASMVNRAIGALRAGPRLMSSRTMLLLDRHFHCPGPGQVSHVFRGFQETRNALRNLSDAWCWPATSYYCRNRPMLMGGAGVDVSRIPPSVLSAMSPQELSRLQDATFALNLCSRFFASPNDYRRAVTVMLYAASETNACLMSTYTCMKRQSCYDDFMVQAHLMIRNHYSYAWFAADLAGHPVRHPAVIPCRSRYTGRNVWVAPGAGSSPRTVQVISALSARDVPGARLVQLYRDPNGRYFVRSHDPEAGLYRPAESPRLYLPEDWRP